MKPRDLLLSHRYQEARDAYKRDINENPGKNYYAGLGRSLLALKDYQEAFNCFVRDNEIENSRVKGNVPSIEWAGTALWLMGKRVEAVETWHMAAAGIMDRSIHYADTAGGGAQGLLLWYGAITVRDSTELDFALKYLRSLTRKNANSTAKRWPNPVILMVLGEKTFAEILTIVCDSPVLADGITAAEKDPIKRLDLCLALFYDACLHRQAGDEGKCVERMRLCFQLKNPIYGCEWYLARAEMNS